MNFFTCSLCGIVYPASTIGVTSFVTLGPYPGKDCPACKLGNSWIRVTEIDMYLNVKTVEYKKGESQCG